MSEDKKEKLTHQLFTLFLIAQCANYGVLDTPITVQVGGIVISGIAVSFQEYIEHFQHFWTRVNAEAYEKRFGDTEDARRFWKEQNAIYVRVGHKIG